ncbi:hypothetical protein ACUOCP_51595, partial [Escherichia sp. R-CC3]
MPLLQLYWSYNHQPPEIIPDKYLLPPLPQADDRKQKKLIPPHSLFDLLSKDMKFIQGKHEIFRDSHQPNVLD